MASRLGVVLSALALGALYAPVLGALAKVWWTHPYAGHGLFVPGLSLLFLWIEWPRLRAARGRGDGRGLLGVVAALGLLALGGWLGSVIVQGLSLVLAVGSFCLWTLGARWLRAAAFPIGFLVFMVPLPRAVVDAVTLPLQIFAASFAARVLDLLEIPLYLDGLYIRLPGITLEVAEVCNGLRFLAGLVVMTTAFAQLSQRTPARKAVLVISAIPVAILANALRVAAVASGAYYIGPEAASGTIHNWIGKSVWVFTILMLLGLGLGLRRWGARPARDAAKPAGAELR